MDFKEHNKPIYLQIADRICDEVMAGTYGPESRIPSVREYAATVQVNANTVMRTYDHLSAQGIIYNKRGIGFFISPDARNKIEQIRVVTFYNDEMQYFFSRLSRMGATPQQLKDLYENYLMEHI